MENLASDLLIKLSTHGGISLAAIATLIVGFTTMLHELAKSIKWWFERIFPVVEKKSPVLDRWQTSSDWKYDSCKSIDERIRYAVQFWIDKQVVFSQKPGSIKVWQDTSVIKSISISDGVEYAGTMKHWNCVLSKSFFVKNNLLDLTTFLEPILPVYRISYAGNVQGDIVLFFCSIFPNEPTK